MLDIVDEVRGVVMYTNEFGFNQRIIKLLEKRDTRTSRGILSKAWYSLDDEPCMAKGNSMFDNIIGYEPYSEVLAYKLGSLLNLNCIEYWLEEAYNFPEIKTYKLDYVSVCPNFLKTNEVDISLLTYIHTIKGYPDINYWEDCIKNTNLEEDISKMLILDYLIGNEDRHLNNIGLIYNSLTESFKVGPIYDNGASLLAWTANSDLNKATVPHLLDKSKPFRSKHRKQINLINKDLVSDVIKNVSLGDILECINPDLEDLPQLRKVAIKSYIQWRFKYLKGLIS